MMKRILVFLTAILLLMMLVACGESTGSSTPADKPAASTENTLPAEKPAEGNKTDTPVSHTHKYDSKVTKEATCGAEGTKTFTCSCGNTYAEAIAATGKHSYDAKVTTEATCVKDGVKTFTCSGCKNTYTEVIKATGKHNYEGKVTTAASCTADGVKTFTCSCGDAYTEVIKATGKHNYEGKVTTVPTCTTEGVQTFACGCGDTYSEPVPPTGHSHTLKETQAPTCTAEGKKVYACACGDTYSESVPATGHSHTLKETQAPTCTAEGKKVYACACGDTYSEPVPATGHSHTLKETQAPTCTAEGKKIYACACGDTYSEAIPVEHKWTDATCTSAKVCTLCGKTEGDALGHSMSNSVCTRCGEKITVVLYEDSSVKITFKNAEKSKYDEDRMELYFNVQNKTGKTLMIQADAVSLNGYSYNDLVMSDKVPGASVGTINLTVSKVDFNLVDIDSIRSIGGQFRIIDDATWKSYDAIFPNLRLDGTGTDSIPTDFDRNQLLYSDKNCAVYYDFAEAYAHQDGRLEMYFYVENKTSKTLMFQADAVSVNGYGFCDLVMSDPVLPYTIGRINLSVSRYDFDRLPIESIFSIGGQFRVIDDATMKSYNAIFTNVKLDGTGVGTKPQDFQKNNLLYSDSRCSIYYQTAEKYPYRDDRLELYLYVENKTSGTLLIQADTISINGYGFSDLTMSDPVLAGSIGTVNVSVSKYDFGLAAPENIRSVGGQLRIIDDANWSRASKAVFTNVPVA